MMMSCTVWAINLTYQHTHPVDVRNRIACTFCGVYIKQPHFLELPNLGCAEEIETLLR